MSDNRFETPEADLGDDTVNNMRYGGFWVRLFAMIIDYIWMGLLFAALLYFLVGPEALLNEDPTAVGAAGLIIQYLLPPVVIIAFWNYFGATPGKMIFGLKICKASDGSKATLGQCIGRYFGYILSTIVLFIGFFWVAFDKRKQGWHDKLAKTVVLKTRE